MFFVKSETKTALYLPTYKILLYSDILCFVSYKKQWTQPLPLPRVTLPLISSDEL